MEGAGRSEGRAVDCMAIAGCGALVAILVRPFPNTPFVDDWVYAWSVERLLAGLDLRVLDWSSHPNFAHVLWGALFCLPTGFSFTALRLSTWVAGVSAVCGLYLLARELGAGRRGALLGAATLGLNPIFLVLSASFMSDVPFVAAMIWSTNATVLAVRRRSDRWLVAGALLACVAAAVRVVAVVMPIAAVLTLLLHAPAFGRRLPRLAVAAAPLVFLALLLHWTEGRTVHVADLSGIVGSPVFRRLYFVAGLAHLPHLLLSDLLFLAGGLGLALLPLTAACATRSAARRALVASALLVAAALVFRGGYPTPLAMGQTWALTELGATEPLVAPAPPEPLPSWRAAIALPVTFFSFSLWLVSLRRSRDGGEALLAWMVAGFAGIAALLWLFYDRYLLPIVPLAIALLLVRHPRPRAGVAAALVALFALLGIVGLRDHLAYDRALWQAVQRLRAHGASDAEIDAGYVVNGWLHYAHPENAPRDERGAPYFPWVTHPAGVLRYQVTNRPLAGWRVLATVPYRRWLGRSGAIFVLEREPDETGLPRRAASEPAQTGNGETPNSQRWPRRKAA